MAVSNEMRSQSDSPGCGDLQFVAREHVDQLCALCGRFLRWEREEILKNDPSPRQQQEHQRTLRWLLHAARLLHSQVADPDFPDRSARGMQAGVIWQLEGSWKAVYEAMAEAQANNESTAAGALQPWLGRIGSANKAEFSTAALAPCPAPADLSGTLPQPQPRRASGSRLDRAPGSAAASRLIPRNRTRATAEQELSIMAAVGQMVNLPRNEIAVGPWHQSGIAALSERYRQKAGEQNSR